MSKRSAPRRRSITRKSSGLTKGFKLDHNHIKAILFAVGFIMLTLIPIVGGIILIIGIIHHFKTSKKSARR